jgi:hypothetical protein
VLNELIVYSDGGYHEEIILTDSTERFLKKTRGYYYSDIYEIYMTCARIKRDMVVDFIKRCKEHEFPVSTPQRRFLQIYYIGGYPEYVEKIGHPGEYELLDMTDINDELRDLENKLANMGIKHTYVSMIRKMNGIEEIWNHKFQDERSEAAKMSKEELQYQQQQLRVWRSVVNQYRR